MWSFLADVLVQVGSAAQMVMVLAAVFVACGAIGMGILVLNAHLNDRAAARSRIERYNRYMRQAKLLEAYPDQYGASVSLALQALQGLA